MSARGLPRPAILAALVLVCAVGCGGPSTDTDTPARSQDRKDEAAPANGDKPKGKRWGGWRWKGTRDDCFFLVQNRCFDKLEAACKAASCGQRRCTHDGAAPAKVSCKK